MLYQGVLELGVGANGKSGKTVLVKNTTDADFSYLLSLGFGQDESQLGQTLIFADFDSAIEASRNGLGDTIMVADGAYEVSTAVVVDKSNLTIKALGGRGAAYIEGNATAVEGMQVTADDVTLINIGVAGGATSDYAININAASRFRAYGCKFEGPDGIIMLLNGTADDQTADLLVDDCEFAWGGKAIVFDDSAYGYPTQIRFTNCWFHDIVTQMFGVNTGGLVKGLSVEDCVFDNLEDGTAPTDYILLSDNGNTGSFSGNRFATATNATGVLTIGTGILWMSNATEAGWSTARPS